MNDRRGAILQARAHAAAGRREQATALLTRVLQKTPGDPLLNFEMARLVLAAGEQERSRYFLERAVTPPLRDADLACEAGRAFMRLGDRVRALALFTAAATIAPASPVPRGALGALHMLEGRFASAVRECLEGLRCTPDQPDLANTCGMALLQMGRAPEALDWLRRAAASAGPDRLLIRSNLALATNYCPDISGAETLECHRAYARGLLAGLSAAGRSPPDRPSVDRLTVVFLSPDFIGHSVGYFVRPILAHLDRGRFRVVCFSTAPDRPGDDARRPPCDTWRDVSALGIDRLAEAIRAERCHILVELSGHMMGNRLPVMRLRAAPVQVTYLGYPNTTGLDEVGARLVDSTTDPASDADARVTERLVRLDPCFLCYAASSDAPPVVPRPAGAPITFGSFNALSKLNDGVVALWTRILGAVGAARLMLKASGLGEEEVRADIAARFTSAGLDPGRIDFAPWTGSNAAHLGLYGRVDIGLDPFPYNGTTTTAEALWMGVPVVTLAGDRHAGRVGMSLLTAAGLPQLIARSPDEYITIAAGLAADRDALAVLRASLRERVSRSLLCDGPAMARRFGEALAALWLERHPDGARSG